MLNCAAHAHAQPYDHCITRLQKENNVLTECLTSPRYPPGFFVGRMPTANDEPQKIKIHLYLIPLGPKFPIHG